MRTHVYQLQDILNAFKRRKVLTKDELLDAVGCSTMTAWRLSRPYGYFTSYNDNARHYTLVDIPRFDEHGLWTYHQARFSKWGSLTDTIVGLVGESSAGLTADQLRRRLHLKDAQPLLLRLTQRKLLTREKMEGCFVYFPLQETARGRLQKQRTKEIERARAARTLPPAEHIVALLVQIIQRPRDTPRQWARRLAQRNIRIATRDIQAILEHYGIDSKKGLLNF